MKLCSVMITQYTKRTSERKKNLRREPVNRHLARQVELPQPFARVVVLNCGIYIAAANRYFSSRLRRVCFSRRGDRAAEGARLESVCAETYPGFKSQPLRDS